LAAIVVAFYHSLEMFVPSGAWARIYRGASNILYGPGAVFTFLILSGFVLGLSLARHHYYSLANVPTFLVRRFWRLWPGMLGIAVIYEVYGLISDRFFLSFTPSSYAVHWVSFKELCLNLLLLRTSLNPVTWSLQVEWIFSLLVPVTFVWTHGKPARNFVILAVALYVYYFFNADYFHRKSFEVPWCFVFMCYGGVILAEYRQRFADAIGKLPAPVRLAGVLGAFAVCAVTPHFGNHLEIFALAMMFLIGAIVSGKFPRLFQFLDFKPLVWLGNVSYSFYLLNPLMLCISATLLCWIMGRRELETHFVVSDVLIAVASIILTIPASALSFRFLERPFLRRTA
jgi:peptidoglycan/LPS O-acetylase OafA/YrhL